MRQKNRCIQQINGYWKINKFTNAMAVVNQILTPAQQNSLAIQGINIQILQKELDNVTQEITTIYSTISAEKTNVPTPT